MNNDQESLALINQLKKNTEKENIKRLASLELKLCCILSDIADGFYYPGDEKKRAELRADIDAAYKCLEPEGGEKIKCDICKNRIEKLDETNICNGCHKIYCSACYIKHINNIIERAKREN